MRAHLLIVSCLLVVTSASASKQAEGRSSTGLFPYEIFEKTLDNGLRVAVVPTDKRGMFAMREVIGVGSRDEVEAGYSGFAHFFEHMMFRGTERFPPDARGKLLNNSGVNEGGTTSDDHTIYSLTGPKDALEDIIALEGDRYQNLKYDEDVFRTESRAVLGEYNKSFANPNLKAWFKLRETAFSKHPYRHTPIGKLADIKKMPERYKYAQRFFKRFYTPDNVLILVTGDVDPAQVFGLIEVHFGAWQGKRAKTQLQFDKPLTGPRRSRINHEAPTEPRGFAAWRIPSAAVDPASNALCAILESYLFSASSSLYDELVLQKRWVQNLSTWWWAHKDPALFPVYFQLGKGAKSNEVVDAIQGSLDAIALGEVDSARFKDVQSHLTYARLMRLDSAERIADRLANAAGPTLNPHAFGAALDEIQKRTPAELARFVKATFPARQRITTIVDHTPALGGAK